MKRILAVTFFTLILTGTQCQIAAAQEGSKPIPPFQIFDNRSVCQC